MRLRAERPKANMGAAMLSMANLLRVAIQIVAIPLLARILGPYPYGVMAIAMPIAIALASICDFGLSSVLVRHSDKQSENTGFWIATTVTSITLLALAILSYLLSIFVHPDTGTALLALGMMLPVSCLMSIPVARLTRQRRLGIIALGDVLGIALGLAAALFGAICNLGFWSLVLQQLFILVMRAATYIAFAGFRPRIEIDTGRVFLLISEGARVTGSNLFEAAARTFDNMLTGILLGPRPAGAYTMAFQFARLPEMVLGGPLSMSIIGKGASLQKTDTGSTEIYRSHLHGLAFIVFPAMTGLALVADDFSEVILGPQWSGTGSILRGLCGAGAFLALGTVNQAVLTALEAYKDRLVLSAVSLAGVLFAVGLGSFFDAVWLSYFVSTSYTCQFVLGVWLSSNRSAKAVLSIIQNLIPTAAGTMAMSISIIFYKTDLAFHFDPILDLLMITVVGIASYILAMLIIRRKKFLDDVSDIRALFS